MTNISETFNQSLAETGKSSDSCRNNGLGCILKFNYCPVTLRCCLLGPQPAVCLSRSSAVSCNWLNYSKINFTTFFLFFLSHFLGTAFSTFPVNTWQCGVWKLTRHGSLACPGLSFAPRHTTKSFVCTIFFYSEQYNTLVLVINAFMWSSSAKRMLLDCAPRQHTSARSIQSQASAHSLLT